jgi:hypothetical protein
LLYERPSQGRGVQAATGLPASVSVPIAASAKDGAQRLQDCTVRQRASASVLAAIASSAGGCAELNPNAQTFAASLHAAIERKGEIRQRPPQPQQQQPLQPMAKVRPTQAVRHCNCHREASRSFGSSCLLCCQWRPASVCAVPIDRYHAQDVKSGTRAGTAPTLTESNPLDAH